jgi:hypothetical protein
VVPSRGAADGLGTKDGMERSVGLRRLRVHQVSHSSYSTMGALHSLCSPQPVVPVSYLRRLGRLGLRLLLHPLLLLLSGMVLLRALLLLQAELLLLLLLAVLLLELLGRARRPLLRLLRLACAVLAVPAHSSWRRRSREERMRLHECT